MSNQTTGQSQTVRRITDSALIIIAVAALAAWLWRRLGIRSSLPTERANGIPPSSDENIVGAAAGSESGNTSA